MTLVEDAIQAIWKGCLKFSLLTSRGRFRAPAFERLLREEAL